MKILVYGPKARYDAYMPDFAAQLGAELVFCTLDQSPRQAAAENPDAQVLFDDPIVDVGREIIDLLPNLKLIQSEGVAFNRIDLEAAREKGIFVCNNKGCNADSRGRTYRHAHAHGPAPRHHRPQRGEGGSPSEDERGSDGLGQPRAG